MCRVMDTEELAIFDILSKPRLDITPKEEKQVKRVAKDLLSISKATATPSNPARNVPRSRPAVRPAPMPALCS